MAPSEGILDHPSTSAPERLGAVAALWIGPARTHERDRSAGYRAAGFAKMTRPSPTSVSRRATGSQSGGDRLDDWASRAPSMPAMAKFFRVLALDGGGIRGIITARVLKALEDRCGAPIARLFDLIVGTSTGGLLALGLAAPADPPKDPLRVHPPGTQRLDAEPA